MSDESIDPATPDPNGDEAGAEPGARAKDDTAIALRDRRPVGEGLEQAIDVVAWIVLVIGGLAVLVLGVTGVTRAGPEALVAILPDAIGLAVAFLLLRAVAEIIRLQKRAVGLPYVGTISGSRTVPETRCGRCRNLLEHEGRCGVCGARIERVIDVEDLRDGDRAGDGGPPTGG